MLNFTNTFLSKKKLMSMLNNFNCFIYYKLLLYKIDSIDLFHFNILLIIIIPKIHPKTFHASVPSWNAIFTFFTLPIIFNSNHKNPYLLHVVPFIDSTDVGSPPLAAFSALLPLVYLVIELIRDVACARNLPKMAQRCTEVRRF